MGLTEARAASSPSPTGSCATASSSLACMFRADSTAPPARAGPVLCETWSCPPAPGCPVHPQGPSLTRQLRVRPLPMAVLPALPYSIYQNSHQLLLCPVCLPPKTVGPEGTGARCAWLSAGEHPAQLVLQYLLHSQHLGRDEWVKGDPQDGPFSSSPPPCVSSPLVRVFFSLSLHRGYVPVARGRGGVGVVVGGSEPKHLSIPGAENRPPDSELILKVFPQGPLGNQTLSETQKTPQHLLVGAEGRLLENSGEFGCLGNC